MRFKSARQSPSGPSRKRLAAVSVWRARKALRNKLGWVTICSRRARFALW